jgi:FkbM family methyltransferase
LPESFTGPFNYVDCGAVGDFSNPLLSVFSNSLYIGFDPELAVPLEKDNASIYFPVAVSKESGEVQFHRTQNLNCSSFFVPNHEFLDRFIQVGEFFRIVETVPVKVIALDEYLRQQTILDIDFIELDTQGSELDILKGAKDFLSSNILGVRVEVEFSAMYYNQPLFADVDSYLREFGFMLFDLDRYHLRRKTAPVNVFSREQIVWGQALYFKDWKIAPQPFAKQKLCKLALIASFYGFHSYAFEIFEYLVKDDTQILTLQEKGQLKAINFNKAEKLRGGFRAFLKNEYGKFWRSFRGLNKKVTVPIDSNYFWKD